MRELSTEPPDLVLTDVVMPGGGATLEQSIRRDFPGVRLLFMSGYTIDEALGRGVRAGEANLLHKPFTVQALAEKVRDVLAAADPRAPYRACANRNARWTSMSPIDQSDASRPSTSGCRPTGSEPPVRPRGAGDFIVRLGRGSLARSGDRTRRLVCGRVADFAGVAAPPPTSAASCATTCSDVSACAFSSSLAAALSSAVAAVVCVTFSICAIACDTWSIPCACCRLASLTSSTSPFTLARCSS